MAALQSPDTKASSSRKRQSSQSVDHHSAPKQQKNAHRCFPPAIFWDQLSEIPLTKNALRELERRAALERSDDLVQDQNTTESVTRNDNDRVKQPSSVKLELSSSELNEIQRSTKHGGPNLSALRDHRALLEVDKNLSTRRYGSTEGYSTTPEQSDCTETSETMGQYDSAFEKHLIDHHILPDEYEYADGQFPPEPEGEIADRNCVAGGIPFTNFDDLTDGTLAAGNPSFFYGARREQLDQNVRNQLDVLISPST
ncbi:hypothetical protein VHEMI02716 [[Torrubiella] hemipterigena]|uniref:Uncharacterized protein n=1 Tax=[Torrubiella] hemipterigena TaxID=1531966 RepID=A0A0A1T8T5_9HYPO|nr:hypothetical protein VHEMI02716 [[Torrubiella] hemipterigena]